MDGTHTPQLVMVLRHDGRRSELLPQNQETQENEWGAMLQTPEIRGGSIGGQQPGINLAPE